MHRSAQTVHSSLQCLQHPQSLALGICCLSEPLVSQDQGIAVARKKRRATAKTQSKAIAGASLEVSCILSHSN